MSQRGPTSRPPSRHHSPSQSQATGAQTSPSSFQAGPTRLDNSRADSPREPSASGSEIPRQATPRSLGVHTILNPSDPREQQIGLPPSLPRPGEGGSSPSSVGTRQYGVSGSPYQAYGSGPVYGGSGGSTAPLGPSSSVATSVQQESPTPVRPFPPALGAARRMLTPRSPRPPSFSRVATPSNYADPQPSLGFPPSLSSRPGGSHEVAPFPGPRESSHQQTARGNPPSAGPHLPSGGHRSFSQPMQSDLPHFQFPPDPAQAGVGRSPQGLTSTYPQGQYGLPQGTARGYGPQGGASGDTTLSTAIISALQTGGPTTRGSDSVQPHLTLQTNTGEHITVPLDVHQGSRQADEKRHRNAGASARFRARKKERDKDMRETLQRLESENRDLTRHAQEMQAERDFYRSERDRLRELVLRTPEIREHAERGPRSPRSSRISTHPAPPSVATGAHGSETPFAGSFGAGASNPRAVSPATQQQHPPPYAGELERPTRRRRTDPPTADFGATPYAMRPAAQPPSTLPPIITQGFGTPIASAPPSARLPPLRFDQPTAGSPTAAQTPGGVGFGPSPGPPPPGPPLQTQFSPFGRPPQHESGWATGPRDPHEGQHRSPGPPGQ